MTVSTHRPRGPGRNRARHALRAALRARGLEAPARLLGSILVDGLTSAAAILDLFFPAPARDARRTRRRAARVRRWARTAGELKGAFAKAGQFASLHYEAVPPEARPALTALREQVPPLPFELIASAVEAELGAPLEAHFSDFSPVPIGAASIAQVHRAALHDGTPVAVKVMYPWLEPAMSKDLSLLRFALPWVLRRTDDFPRLFDEFTQSLQSETDFEREARTAAQIAANLADHPSIIVPTIYEAHSTQRVLTMSLHEGHPIDDLEGLQQRGVDLSHIAEVLVRAYAQQIFEDGLFHADPHPGNLFVLTEPERPPRVLFLDFGLSQQLSPALREPLRRALYALVQRDPTAFIDQLERLEMIRPGAREDVEDRVVTLFDRIERNGGALAMRGTEVLGLKDEAKRLLEETPGLRLPNDLLLYAKTLSYVFTICERIAPEVDVMRLSTPSLLKFLAAREPTAPTGADPADE
jgi:predicted unusual protein kinase regulating ubiquinone biosynthesis (AarF/ABC1/UbiB family)